MSGGRRVPYTAEQDRLILSVPTGELGVLAERWGKRVKNLQMRRQKLRNLETSMPVHRNLERRKDRSEHRVRSTPFARPTFFDENLGSMAVGGPARIR